MFTLIKIECTKYYTRCPISNLKFKFRIKFNWPAAMPRGVRGSTNGFSEISSHRAFYRSGSYIGVHEFYRNNDLATIARRKFKEYRKLTHVL